MLPGSAPTQQQDLLLQLALLSAPLPAGPSNLGSVMVMPLPETQSVAPASHCGSTQSSDGPDDETIVTSASGSWSQVTSSSFLPAADSKPEATLLSASSMAPITSHPAAATRSLPPFPGSASAPAVVLAAPGLHSASLPPGIIHGATLDPRGYYALAVPMHHHPHALQVPYYAADPQYATRPMLTAMHAAAAAAVGVDGLTHDGIPATLLPAVHLPRVVSEPWAPMDRRRARGAPRGSWTTEEDDEILRMKNRGCRIKDIARAVERSEHAIHCRLTELRKAGLEVKRKRRSWSEEELAVIAGVENKDGVDWKTLLPGSGRSRDAIRRRWDKMHEL